MWAKHDAMLPGADAARGGYEFPLPDAQDLTSDDPRGLHPARDADHGNDEQEDPRFRAECVAKQVPEQQDDDQEQGQQRQSEKQVGEPHEGPVQAAEEACRHADGRAEKQRQCHRGKTYREGDASSGQDLCQHVATEVVSTEGMRPGRALVLDRRVQVLGIQPVNVRANKDRENDQRQHEAARKGTPVLAELPPDVVPE